MEIENILKEKGMTKTALAELLDIKKQSINGLLKNPTLATLEKIANALNVPLWQLFTPSLDVTGSDDEAKITCPNCGKTISIKVE